MLTVNTRLYSASKEGKRTDGKSSRGKRMQCLNEKMQNVKGDHIFLSYKMIWMKYVRVYSLASGMCNMASFV